MSARPGLEVLIQNEGPLVCRSTRRSLRILGPRRGLVDTGLCIIANPLLEEVGLALEGDHVHEIEGVGDVVHLGVAECDKEPIRNELDVLIHQGRVHPDERNGERLGEEFLFDRYGFGDNMLDGVGVGAFAEVSEQETGEVGVHAFVTGDELVGESETGHQTAFLEPEDGCKGTREEDSLDGCEGDQAFTECRTTIRDPFQGPVGFAFDAGDVFDCVEEEFALGGVFDVCVDEEGVSLGVNVLPRVRVSKSDTNRR